MLELANICVKSLLPLHAYLVDNLEICVRIKSEENVLETTAFVRGNMDCGIWECDGNLYLPEVENNFALTVVAKKQGQEEEFLVATLNVPDLVEGIKPGAGDSREFTSPNSPVELTVKCSIKIISSPKPAGSPSGAIAHNSDNEILLLERMVELTPDGHPNKSDMVIILGSALQMRFERLGNLADIDGAITHSQKAVELAPEGHPNRPMYLSTLGGALHSRFERLGSLDDIDQAITHNKKAVEITPDGNPSKPSRLTNLGNALQRRFERLGSLADNDQAITHNEKAMELTSDDHPDKPMYLNNLGNALRSRFQRLGSLDDIDQAVTHKEKAVELTPDDHPNKPIYLNNLGCSLLTRFERLGGRADNDQAITHNEKAVKLTPDDHPDKLMYLNNLGNALHTRFQRLGSLDDINQAITHHEKAVKLAPDDHPEKLMYLNNLGSALQTRFERLGSLDDIDQAITHNKKAVELTPDDHPSKPMHLNSLCNAFHTRFERLGSLADIDQAITHNEKAVKLTPDDHPGKPMYLNNLGIALQMRFQRLSSLDDINQAITHNEKAVELTPDDYLDKPMYLNSLGNALQTRFQRLGSLADIDQAITHNKKAVELTSDGRPDKPGRLCNLGNGLRMRFDHTSTPEDLENIFHSYSKAANSVAGPTMHRFKAARAWALAAEKYSRPSLPAYACAINLLPRIAWLGLGVTDQHALLADVGDIVRDAVAAAIQAEEYDTAVEWAEHGRSIAWQNMLGLRTSLDGLRAAHPQLANRLQNITRQLEGSSPEAVLDVVPVVDVVRQYSKLATEWENTVEEIRRLPNFEGFLKPKSFAELAPAASEGPVVILNVNNLRCDALILIPDDSDDRHVSVTSIPLEGFSDEKSERLFKQLVGLLRSAGVRDGAFRKHEWVEAPTADVAKFEDVLSTLWLEVVKPIMKVLKYEANSSNPPRIWWCATGSLAFLPLHAAGLYNAGGAEENVSDYVVSSYTPTLTAILDIADPTVRQDFQLLTVAQPSTPYATPIPMTKDEVNAVQKLAGGVRIMNLNNKEATVKRVLKGMEESDWIHLACHGRQRVGDPMKSGFLLHDRILQLSEIVKTRLPKADFAFLSACQTAMGDEKIAEESVHLAAGMLLSGCRGIIATMWSIRDKDGPPVAEDVYTRILKDGRPNRKEAAYALHEAVKRLRESEAVKCLRESNARFVAWVPFIHIGR